MEGGKQDADSSPALIKFLDLRLDFGYQIPEGLFSTCMDVRRRTVPRNDILTLCELVELFLEIPHGVFGHGPTFIWLGL